MEQLLVHPAVQAGAAPLLAGLVVAALGCRLRLAGLAAAAGLFVAVYLIGNFAFEPLTATRKLVLVVLAAALVGAIADLAFKSHPATGYVLGAAFGLGALWVFWTVLAQKALVPAFALGAFAALLVLALVASTLPLRADPVRAGAAGFGLGVGAGVGSVLAGSAFLGQYGSALGAACGGFLLVAMILGKRIQPGVALTLTVSVACALIAAGAVLLAKLPWYAAAALAAVPWAVRLPVAERTHPALQVVIASFYALAAAAVSCALAWFGGRAG